jgi:hypothetical protein
MMVFPSRTLDPYGRCCGRKPLFYRTKSGLKSVTDPHWFCDRCCAEYAMNSEQRENWAWLAVEGGFTPKYPESEEAARVATQIKETRDVR